MIPTAIEQRKNSNSFRIQKIRAQFVLLNNCRSRYWLHRLLLAVCLIIVLIYSSQTVSQVRFVKLQSYSLWTYFHDFYRITPRNTTEEIGVPDRPQFQPIIGHDAWVFSAFFDKIDDKRLIRVFGLQDLSLKNPVICYLTENNMTYKVAGHRTLLIDYHGNRYRVASYECDLSPTARPINVSVTFRKSAKPSNSLQVVYPESNQRNFTVCYATLYNYTNYRQIVENVEFNRVLGADHFFVYNMSVSPETDVVLRHYQQRGLLTVIPWPIPVSEIHYNGQVLAVNDCVYRNKGSSRYVVIQDTDEFIIPNYHDNWDELITEVDKDHSASVSKTSKRPDPLGTYTIESTFFTDTPNASEWGQIKRKYSITDEDERLFEKYSLAVFTHLKRLKSIFKNGRQKSIIRPELILFSEVHSTLTHRPLVGGITVDNSLAIVHHQRDSGYAATKVTEVSSLRFKSKVLPAIDRTLKLLPV